MKLLFCTTFYLNRTIQLIQNSDNMTCYNGICVSSALLMFEIMADPKLLSFSHKHCWERLQNTWCSKKILLLLVWQVLFTFSWRLLLMYGLYSMKGRILISLEVISILLAPLIGWFADVKFGRYEIIKLGILLSFFASLFTFILIITGSIAVFSIALQFLIATIVGFSVSCFTVAMLPFMTDQIIGATSDELSTVARWYYWAQNFGYALSDIVCWHFVDDNFESIGAGIAVIYAIPLAVIIVSDCLCQQWLDRTHKVTNPIKLIIQVLNYTRKHRYPERRSAFTYIDEEQPTRMDNGKEKFGGPFTEEEVEDVKTVLRLLPLVTCLSVCVGIFSLDSYIIFNTDAYVLRVLDSGLTSWLIPVLLILIYQLFPNQCRRPSMLQCICAGLFVFIVGYLLLAASGVYSLIHSDIETYLFCGALNTTSPVYSYMKWYLKLGPYILCSIGSTICNVLLLEFIIAQTPNKMKGLFMGLELVFYGISVSFILALKQQRFTLCYIVSFLTALVVLFLVFLILSKRYTLRERNREINIQAIVEEHYERYMDQEEEYRRQQHH